MRVVKNDRTSFWDVDDTLVLAPNPALDATDKMLVNVADPLNPGKFILREKHEAMIRLLMEEHHRGSHIIVWSRGGYEWAAAVIAALGLIEQVDLVMSKPMAYFDDTPVEEWLANRVYIKPGIKYK